eukprot:TRINITY_DN2670_c0_g2_i1.p2 TRINITY_DN2670_c0_g2~~TRINITY_DN2670_c0_g2_i1.p2  ORF type:complete len:392 (-),score=143.52 TRINITY_DN2670_c0_g2_i1:2153-3328(-)
MNLGEEYELNGDQAMKIDRFSEAATFYCEAIEYLIENVVDSDDIMLAPLYYKYGEAMLKYAEQNIDVFGNAALNTIKRFGGTVPITIAPNLQIEESEMLDEARREEQHMLELENRKKEEKFEDMSGKDDNLKDNDDKEQLGMDESDVLNEAKATIDEDEAPQIDIEALTQTLMHNMQKKEMNAAEDDFQLAWQNLETARFLLKQKDLKSLTREQAELLGTVYYRLGEIKMQGEFFQQAIDEFSSSLEVRKDIFGDEAYELAECYTKIAECWEILGTALDIALNNYKIAQTLTKNKLAQLRKLRFENKNDQILINLLGDVDLEHQNLSLKVLDVEEMINFKGKIVTLKEVEDEEREDRQKRRLEIEGREPTILVAEKRRKLKNTQLKKSPTD